jgi:H+/Cl- antiporter ClcA
MITLLSMCLAGAVGLIAFGLTRLIALVTQLSFFGRFSTTWVSPAGNHLGLWVIPLPIIGGLIVGAMARWGSRAIRGHGIPEAMEQVLTNESRIPPRMIWLKPLSSAIAIGTGGPFGAEGPIIATGGALGSFVGQWLPVTADERKTLLAAGAAAGMAAIFASPLAAVLLSIELLLFERRTRSLVPVCMAAAVGAAVHMLIEGSGPVFPMSPVATPSVTALAMYIMMGLVFGVLGVCVTRLVYGLEDAFERLPIHWMWWPAIGGVAVVVIGYAVPSTLGVGYENIIAVIGGNLGIGTLALLAVAKLASWSIALGSGTSGGTLAPLFTIGGATGALLGVALAHWPATQVDPRLAALIGMAALFAGAARAMLTAAVFVFETTLQANTLLPLLAASVAAYLVSGLLMQHTIMTEKIARRGVHVPTDLVPEQRP